MATLTTRENNELVFISALRSLLDLLEGRDKSRSDKSTYPTVSKEDPEWQAAEAAYKGTSDAFRATPLGKAASRFGEKDSWKGQWFAYGSVVYDNLRRELDRHTPLDPLRAEVADLLNGHFADVPQKVYDFIAAERKEQSRTRAEIDAAQNALSALSENLGGAERSMMYLREQLNLKSDAVRNLTELNRKQRDAMTSTITKQDWEIARLERDVASLTSRLDERDGQDFHLAEQRLETIEQLMAQNEKNSKAAAETLEAVVNRKNQQIEDLERVSRRRYEKISGLYDALEEAEREIHRLQQEQAYTRSVTVNLSDEVSSGLNSALDQIMELDARLSEAEESQDDSRYREGYVNALHDVKKNIMNATDYVVRQNNAHLAYWLTTHHDFYQYFH